MPPPKLFKSLQHARDAIKSLKHDEQQKLLSLILKKDPELARQLQNSVFEFNDISLLAKADFKFLWFELPRNMWLLALRGCTPEVSSFIKSCLTLRAHSELIDDLKSLGPQPLTKVLEAQKKLIEEITALAKENKVILPSKK